LFVVCPSPHFRMLSETNYSTSEKCSCISVPGISVGSGTIISQVDVAITLATHCTSVYSSDNYSPSVILLKGNAEAVLLNLAFWLAGSYNTNLV
jgi:hypothetical protein